MNETILQEELADKSAIEDLLIRYSYAVDFHDWKSYEQVFTKDAVIDYTAFGGPKTNVQAQIEYLAKALVVRTNEGWRIKERVEQKSYTYNMPEGFEF